MHHILACRMPLNTMAHAHDFTWQPHDGVPHLALARSLKLPQMLQHPQSLFCYILVPSNLVWALPPPILVSRWFGLPVV
jgi:hypothetical protein